MSPIGKLSIFFLTCILMSSFIVAAGDLTLELEEPQYLDRTGFGQQVLIPYTVTNVGNEAVTSRLGIKAFTPEGEMQGYPLYVFTGDVQIQRLGEEAPIKYPGIPITREDGTTYFQQSSRELIYQNGVVVSEAPTVTLAPGESIRFDDEQLMAAFSFRDSGTYTVGFEVDYANEVQESNEDNNQELQTLDIEIETFVKGPSEDFKLDANQYWFYFTKNVNCLSLDIPEPTQVCLLGRTPLTATLMVGDEKVRLFHFFDTIGLKKKIGNLELVVGDGFRVTYT